MKTFRFPVLVEKDEDGYFIGIVPDLKGCRTQAKSLAELDKRLKQVIALCLKEERAYFHQNTFIAIHHIELSV